MNSSELLFLSVEEDNFTVSNSTTPINFTNPSQDLRFYHFFKSVLGVWLFVACLIGFPANLFTLYCSWKFARTQKSNLLYQWFVFSMSAADFLFLAFVATIQFSQYTFRSRLSRAPCTFMYVMSHSTTVASSLSLLALNVDKFLAIYRPLYHARTLCGRRVFVITLLSWLISLAWALIFVFGPMTEYKDPCLFYVQSYEYYLGFTVVFFVSPTALATLLSIFIAIVVKQQFAGGSTLFRGFNNSNSSRKATAEEIRLDSSSSSPAANRRRPPQKENGSSGSNLQKNTSIVSGQQIFLVNHHRDSSFEKAKRITFVFTTTIFSFLTIIPYRIVFTIRTTSDELNKQSWMFVLATICLGLMIANPVGNPIISVLTQRRYRMELQKIGERVCGRRFFESGRERSRKDSSANESAASTMIRRTDTLMMETTLSTGGGGTTMSLMK